MPNAVKNCQNMTRAPLTLAGAHSDDQIGMVALLGPKPIPSKNLKPTIIRQLLEKACARQEAIENTQEKNMVPRRPSSSFKGWVNLKLMSNRNRKGQRSYLPTAEDATKIRSASNEAYSYLVSGDTKCIDVEYLCCRSKILAFVHQ